MTSSTKTPATHPISRMSYNRPITQSLGRALCWCILSLPSLSLAQIELAEAVDLHDVRYVRIKCQWKDKYLYQDPSKDTVQYEESLDARDLRSHWSIESTPNIGSYWIRNRTTGDSLHIEQQTGAIQIGTFLENYSSQHWMFEADSNYYRIHSTWKPEHYWSTQIETDLTLNYDILETTSISQRFVIESTPIGATLPWTSYDETNYSALLEPAHIVSSTNYDQTSIAAEAQKRGCILLNGFDSTVQWTVTTAADVLNLRYSVADGEVGTITLKITHSDGSYTQKIPVTSAQAWVYFEGGEEHDTPAANRLAAKRYNDARVVLSSPLEIGDTLEFSRQSDDLMTWIDVVEIETKQDTTPSDLTDYYDVTASPWNASGDGSTNDTPAFTACISAATSAGKKVYLPPGRYNLHQQITLPSNAVLQGAGIWQTELIFSQSGAQNDGGIQGNGSNIQLHDFYLVSSQSARDNGYKGLKGYWGTGSVIDNIWIEHTETGAWISDFTVPIEVTDGLIIRNCRIRNTFADGINLAGGTRNSTVENCHFRGTGDDALASWSAGYQNGYGMTTYHKLRYNSIECGYRAAGIGIFGGEGHRIHHNLVRDQFAGAGIRFNTIFYYNNSGTRIGYGFGTADSIEIYSNQLERTGTRGLYGEELAAIDIQTLHGNVHHLNFEDIQIDGSAFSGIRFNGIVNASTRSFDSINFTDVSIENAPIGSRATGAATGSAIYNNVTVAPPALAIENVTAGFSIIDITGGILFTPSNGNNTVSEDGAQDSYEVILHAAPTANVTLALQADSQINISASTLSFTPANWSRPQTITISAIDDLVDEGTHSGSISHSISSTDPTYNGTTLPNQSVTILDNDINTAPVITLNMPTAVAIPGGAGLMLEASVSDDGKPLPSSLSTQWQILSGPAGGSVNFDDATTTNAGVTFNLAGTYLLRLNADDGALNGMTDITVHYDTISTDALFSSQDIGSVSTSGSSSRSESAGTWSISGSGSDIWNQSDEFQYLAAPFTGDGSITVRLLSQTHTNEWAKVGLMIRDSHDANAAHSTLAITANNGLAWQQRNSTGDISYHTSAGSYSFPLWLKLTRSGSTITAEQSTDGTNWATVGDATPDMSGDDMIGIAITSHSDGTLSTATFDQFENTVLNIGALADSGSDTFIARNQSVNLSGSASDDGKPSTPGTLSYTWQQVSGPDSLSFTNPNSLNTSTAPTTIGSYQLRLQADDGSVTTFHDRSLTVQTELVFWQNLYFGNDNPAAADLSADPDGDQLTNLAEFAFGSSPTLANHLSALIPQASIQSNESSQTFKFNYRRRTGNGSGSTESGYTIDGITYTVETTPILTPADWQTGPTRITQLNPPLDNNDGTETVTVQYNTPISSPTDPSAFMRLKLSSVE
jgi:hypothetical protein